MAVLNPNNWHWIDKNTLPWSKEYFNDKFGTMNVELGEERVVTVRSVVVNGDSNVSQRKGKPICYFDLHITMEVYVGDENVASVDIPEFMHDDMDFEVRLNCTDGDVRGDLNKQFVPQLYKLMEQYQKDLLEEHSRDLQMGA